MLKINCVKGMKVTTTGDTWRVNREDSDCCKEEKRVGYITLTGETRNGYVMVECRRNGRTLTTGFKEQNVHLYKGSE